MSAKKKVLRFVVTGALLGAPLLSGCGADNDMVNEPEPESEETINEPIEEDTEATAPEEDDGSGTTQRRVPVNEPFRPDEPAQPE